MEPVAIVILVLAVIAAVVAGVGIGVRVVSRKVKRSAIGMGVTKAVAVSRAVSRSPQWRYARASLPVVTTKDSRMRTVRAQRRDLALAVEDARIAVDAARTAGAPLGELPSLMSRLEKAANGQQMILSGLETPSAAPDQVDTAAKATKSIVDAATRIRSAATQSVQRMEQPALTDLAAEVARETEALQAGLDRLG